MRDGRSRISLRSIRATDYCDCVEQDPTLPSPKTERESNGYEM
jgi:hypothetical protein